MFMLTLPQRIKKIKMDTQKDQIVDRLKQATNILVTVSSNPSVDQLAGAIGFTLLLNKLGKHATAVFSGAVPSTIDFLQPDKTLEKTTDSLRDFIIALDKSKADKLRYKVEDQMVKIFITPYMTSITDKDLEFSQGDFNVEVVVALGVREQQDLDQAITAHGRILHDATVIGISTQEGTSLGSLNWVDPAASSLCEMLSRLGVSMKEDVLDSQMATALLTGIVAETNRFSNEKTSSETMQLSAKLMTAGANQQLVASQLQPPAPKIEPVQVPDPVLPELESNIGDELPPIEDIAEDDDDQPPIPELVSELPVPPEPPKPADGTLQINHEIKDETDTEPVDHEHDDAQEEPDESVKEPVEVPVSEIHIDENGQLNPTPVLQTEDHQVPASPPGGRFLQEPPSHGGLLTANTEGDQQESNADMLSGVLPSEATGPLLSHDNTVAAQQNEEPAWQAPPDQAETLPETSVTDIKLPDTAENSSQAPVEDAPQTLADLEQAVESPHMAPLPEQDPDSNPPVHVDNARDAVHQAMQSSEPQILPPTQSLNAQHMDLNLGDMPAVATSLASAFAETSSNPDGDLILPGTDNATQSQSSNLPPLTPFSPSSGAANNPGAPPPVPPPFNPPAGSDDPTVM